MAVSTMKFPAERVVELEAELKEVRAAFEEYITSSKELEAGLDKELSDLRKSKTLTSSKCDVTAIARLTFCCINP